MGILDGIVEWIAEQVMAGLDLVTTSVLGALGCDMAVFLRYFPAAETMYSVFVALAIGIILLNWVWQLFKNFGLGAGVEAEDPVKLSIPTLNGSASTFNKQTNVRLDNKYTVLDISSLTGDLLTVGMFVALDFVWDRAKADRTEEKAIFIDECWQLLSGAGAAGVRLAGDFLLEIAKTIRGYGGASIFASQDLADFFDLDGGRFGKGIINNSKTKIILNLEDDEAQRVQEALHLSDAETMEITHFERGHGLISTNNNNIMVEFKASPLEKDLITTDRRELREIVERKRREQSTSAEQQI